MSDTSVGIIDYPKWQVKFDFTYVEFGMLVLLNPDLVPRTDAIHHKRYSVRFIIKYHLLWTDGVS